MALTLKNVLIGVACIVVISMLAGGFQSYVYDPPLPVWLEQAIIIAIAVLAWFGIAARVNG